MSLLNRTAPAHTAAVRPSVPGTASTTQPRPLLGGRYVTTRRPLISTEGTYVTTDAAGPLTARGTYVTSSRRRTGDRTEGSYTDRG
ncbi:hypothetical protein [Arthrobacter sp. H20]|uniref:hypothetical protein n=1 Tax=Arthrobacter sp. H20 TaxID=1267981 RepID=UPI00047B58D4|nr:hypothetical protein [Arthrobacter sp. H20]